MEKKIEVLWNCVVKGDLSTLRNLSDYEKNKIEQTEKIENYVVLMECAYINNDLDNLVRLLNKFEDLKTSVYEKYFYYYYYALFFKKRDEYIAAEFCMKQINIGKLNRYYEMENPKELNAIIFKEYAEILCVLRKNELSLKYALKAKRIFAKNKNFKNLYLIAINISETYQLMGDYNNSERILFYARKFCEEEVSKINNCLLTIKIITKQKSKFYRLLKVINNNELDEEAKIVFLFNRVQCEFLTYGFKRLHKYTSEIKELLNRKNLSVTYIYLTKVIDSLIRKDYSPENYNYIKMNILNFAEQNAMPYMINMCKFYLEASEDSCE